MSAAYTVTLATRPLWQTPAALAPLEAAAPAAVRLHADDAAAYAVAGGELPPGVALSGGGVLSGAPSRAGAYAFDVAAASREADGAPAVRAFTVTVGAEPAWLTPADVDLVAGAAAGEALAASGAARYELASGALPGGMALGADGALSGAAAAAGTAAFTVRAVDATGRFASQRAFRAAVRPPLRWRTAGAVDLEAGADAAQPLLAEGALRYELAAGALPEGVQLSGRGVLTGRPSGQGRAEVTVRAHGVAASADAALVVRVGARPTWTTPPALGEHAGRVALQLRAAGATAYAAAAALPAGLTLATDGRLGGTPAVAGPARVRVRASGAVPALSATREFELTAAPAPVFATAAALPPAPRGVRTSLLLVAEHAAAPLALADGSAAPPGLALSGRGALEGAPTAEGRYRFSVAARGYGGSAATTREFTLTVAPPPA